MGFIAFMIFFGRLIGLSQVLRSGNSLNQIIHYKLSIIHLLCRFAGYLFPSRAHGHIGHYSFEQLLHQNFLAM